jgi:signal transduction histidine kinase
MYVIIPMLDDGVALGTLIIGYSRSLFLPRFYGIVQRVAFSSLAVMALLLPFGWYLGKRMAAPLAKVVDCLAAVGRKPADQIRCDLCEGKDEVGKLGIRCQQMIQELQEKQRLAREMVASERLAAVGRLAAGVAHEINNPLGGMLNAIDTFKHHGCTDAVTGKTLSLLERGLGQPRADTARRG